MRLAYQTYERDRRQAGALLAGGIAYRLFLWLLPTALFAVGIRRPRRRPLIHEPQRVAHDAGFGAALALTVAQAAQQSGKGSIYLVLLGGVLALWAGRAAVKALMRHGLGRLGDAARLAHPWPREVSDLWESASG